MFHLTTHNSDHRNVNFYNIYTYFTVARHTSPWHKIELNNSAAAAKSESVDPSLFLSVSTPWECVAVDVFCHYINSLSIELWFFFGDSFPLKRERTLHQFARVRAKCWISWPSYCGYYELEWERESSQQTSAKHFSVASMSPHELLCLKRLGGETTLNSSLDCSARKIKIILLISSLNPFDIEDWSRRQH